MAAPAPCAACGLDTWAMRETRAVHFHCSTLDVWSYDRALRADRMTDFCSVLVDSARAAAMREWGEHRDEANAWEHVRIYTTLPCPPDLTTFSDVMNHRGLAIGHTRREVYEAIMRITVGVMLWRRGENDLREVVTRHGGYTDIDGGIVWPREDIALLPNQHEMLRGHAPGSPGAIVEENNRVLGDAMHYEYAHVEPLWMRRTDAEALGLVDRVASGRALWNGRWVVPGEPLDRPDDEVTE